MVPPPPALVRGGGSGQGPGHAARNAPAISTTAGRFVNTFDQMEVWAVPDGSEARLRRRSHERDPGDEGAGPLPGLRRARDAHPRGARPRQPRGHERLRGDEGRPREAGPLLPGALRRPRGAGGGRLRLPDRRPALQPELRQEPVGLRVDRRPGGLVGRRRRGHRGPRRHRLLPRGHRRGHHGLRGHAPRRHPAHRPRRLPQRLRRHLAPGDPDDVPALPRARRRPGRADEARKYKLFGVRPDTSSNLRDVSVPPLGDKRLDCGVNPRLVFAMREAIDRPGRPGGSRARIARPPRSTAATSGSR